MKSEAQKRASIESEQEVDRNGSRAGLLFYWLFLLFLLFSFIYWRGRRDPERTVSSQKRKERSATLAGWVSRVGGDRRSVSSRTERASMIRQEGKAR